MTNNIQVVNVHGKVDGILKEFIVINPTNLVINEGEVAGEMVGADGKTPLMVTRTLLNFPNRMQLILEETPTEILEMFEDKKNQDKPGFAEK